MKAVINTRCSFSGVLSLFMLVFGLVFLAFTEQSVADDKVPVTTTNVVNVNTASAQQLAAALRGVGERRAQAIVAYRDQHGPFTDIEQLLEVKGIGSSTLQQNKALIVLE